MNSNVSFPWISRKYADEIYQYILSCKPAVKVYLVRASAGVGKTFLARDIGVRLKSDTGYGPGKADGLRWAGIQDFYDLENLSNRRIELHLVNALSDVPIIEFNDYNRERKAYEDTQKSGYYGFYLEEQRKKVEQAFAAGLRQTTEKHFPVIAFDTVERLQTALDPTETFLGEVQDTATVWDWLMFQIGLLPRGVIILLGRSLGTLESKLGEAIAAANQRRAIASTYPDQNSFGAVELKIIDLPPFDDEECDQVFSLRERYFPGLSHLLLPGLRNTLKEYTRGNPLFIDIALQNLLETQDPNELEKILKTAGGINHVGGALITQYMNRVPQQTTRKTLLQYLGIARNGLTRDILSALEPNETHAGELWSALNEMENLPFIKVREIQGGYTGKSLEPPRKAFYLHDAMFEIFEQLGLLTPEYVVGLSQKIADYYDQEYKRLEKTKPADLSLPPGRRPDALLALHVNSLIYHLRANPHNGYRWYLEQSDQAIRNVETSYDMRLRDGVANFLASSAKTPVENLPVSVIDREIVRVNFPTLDEDFSLDSAMLWTKRFSLRGKHLEAEELAGRVADRVAQIFRLNKKYYLIPYSEFRLWHGTSIMYGKNPRLALSIFQEIIKELEAEYSLTHLKSMKEGHLLTDQELKRICLLLGRSYNNFGYINWMYLGRYWRSIGEFETAIEYFDLADLKEEKANSMDNIGRVYALLGHSFAAFESIKEGLELRRGIGQPYRIALSENSLALTFLRFDEVTQGIETVERAQIKFRQVGIERGIGLSKITLGNAYRVLAEQWRDNGYTAEEALKLLDEKAQVELNEAIRIFQHQVQEPVRLVMALNEQACVYRARYLILRDLNAQDEEKNSAYENGMGLFETASTSARDYHYDIEYLDNQQDQAVLMFRAGKNAEAAQLLEKIRQQVPTDYRLLPGTKMKDFTSEEQVDAYYKIMGQVELLAANLIYESNISTEKTREELDRKADIVLQAMEHYLLAVAYFNQFSIENFTHRQTFARIYKRLRNCSRELIDQITGPFLDEWLQRYDVEYELVRNLIEEVFGLISSRRRLRVRR